MTFARILDGPWPIPSSRAGPPYRMLPNEIRSGTPSVVRMLIGRSQTLPSLLLPHSRSVSNSLRRRKPGFAPRMHGCGRRLPRCRRSPRLSAGTILARVAAAKSSRSAASIEGLPGSPYRACCKEGAPQTGAIRSFSNPFSLATLTMNIRYRVDLSDAERSELQTLLRGGRHAARKLKRAQILLAADAGVPDETIAQSLGVGGSTVYRTKRRFVAENELKPWREK